MCNIADLMQYHNIDQHARFISTTIPKDVAIRDNIIKHLPLSSSYAGGISMKLNERTVADNTQRMKHTAAQLCPVMLCSILKANLELNAEYTCKLLLVYTTMQLHSDLEYQIR